jgi:hypothetical protein
LETPEAESVVGAGGDQLLDDSLERAAEKVGVGRGFKLREKAAYGIVALRVGRHRAFVCVVAEECRDGGSRPPVVGAGLVHLASGLYWRLAGVAPSMTGPVP